MSAQTEGGLTTFASAALSGSAQAVLFNPIDRALFLRVHNRRPSLFCWENFKHPFQGFGNAALYRTVSSGTYLYYQDIFRRRWIQFRPALEQESPTKLNLLVGLSAGCANAALLNPLQLIKYHMWSADDPNAKFFGVARKLMEHGGASILVRGIGVSICRDVCFGVTYECARLPQVTRDRHESVRFAVNTAAASLASAMSAPFNYCRNMIYGAPIVSCPLRMRLLIEFLLRETWNDTGGFRSRMNHLNARLNVGWGSLRVGIGMAVGQLVFARCKDFVAAARKRS